ncbi:hypothetical protein [Pseudemcibacter aquimaris]|uniref:hypothetical protein n=1 Tax=Pseudemcibacter aquimaris TaxID=2857064 RepID=UPI002013030B|nr:hypothetical protein [Pseudemcibacter aquimaris]MCC3861252.1 hypothetical protein [Pseudemcibacter aquimaris]WDU58026.1 hypothetical protein KW060_12580 [Pseudemcibacter aquimaris]
MNVQAKVRKKHIPTEKEADFLSKVQNAKYDRQIVTGLQKFMDGKVDDDMKDFYTEEELAEIAALKGTNRDIEARMPVKMTRHYFERARVSPSVRTLVKASPAETFDLAGSEDPGKQMSYSPVEGLIHKYELGLIYVAGTCSAHCRFCYREELIAKKEIVREDGSIQAKGLAQIPELVEYIKEHNKIVDENGGRHPETGRERLREILMSGGDPMVLANKGIASWWAALSEAGIESIRLGTKELAFFPDRFDDSFFQMMDDFHEAYPETRLRFMIHFNHPDEFLDKDEDGNYIPVEGGGLKWVESTGRAVKEFGKRGFVTLDNQAPIIKNISDDPDAKRIMQRELRRAKVENHYFFCGRDIVGHKAFNVPIEEAWNILNTSQRGLSGVEAHARLSITHYYGKTEVVAVTNEPIPGVPHAENGVVIFKLLRSAEDAPKKGQVAIVGRNPDAIWFDDYKDRVISDEAGLFSIKA